MPGLVVVHGALIECDKCPGTLGTLVVVDLFSPTAEGQPVATINANVPGKNIFPFPGICLKTQKPCVPQTATPWTPPESSVLLPSLAPLLAQNGTLACTTGDGIIRVLDPGQSTFDVNPPPGTEPILDGGELVGYARTDQSVTHYYDLDGNLVDRQFHDGIEPTGDLLWVIPGGGAGKLAKGIGGFGKRLLGIGASKALRKFGARAPMHVLRLLRHQVTTRADRLAANRFIGLKREAQVLVELRKEGYEHLGSQVAVKTSLKFRYIDHLVKDPRTQEITAIEVKSGKATRNTKQIAKDTEMEQQGAAVIGKHAHEDVKGQIIKIKTEVRR